MNVEKEETSLRVNMKDQRTTTKNLTILPYGSKDRLINLWDALF